MTLVANETDARNKMVVVGKLQLSRQFMAFHINDGYAWEPLVLSQFIKMNRASQVKILRLVQRLVGNG